MRKVVARSTILGHILWLTEQAVRVSESSGLATYPGLCSEAEHKCGVLQLLKRVQIASKRIGCQVHFGPARPKRVGAGYQYKQKRPGQALLYTKTCSCARQTTFGLVETQHGKTAQSSTTGCIHTTHWTKLKELSAQRGFCGELLLANMMPSRIDQSRRSPKCPLK